MINIRLEERYRQSSRSFYASLRLIAVSTLFFVSATANAFVISVDDNVTFSEDETGAIICALDNDLANGEATPLVTRVGSFAFRLPIISPIASVNQINSSSCTTPVTGGNFNAFQVNLIPNASGNYDGLYYGTYDAFGGAFTGGACSSPESPGSETNSCGVVFITVNSVNDVPSFTAGPDQVVNEDSGSATVNNWATGISKGPSNENSQTLSFNVSSNNNGLFSVQPAIASNGQLTFKPAANANGVATVTVSLSDSGGTANGGSDRSADQVFTITVNAVNDQPIVNSAFADFTATEDDPDDTTDVVFVFDDADIVTNADTLTYTVSNNTNGTLVNASMAGSTLTLAYQANQSGSADITLRATDGSAQFIEDTFTVTVDAVADTPTGSATAAIATNEDIVTTALGITGALVDGDGSETLTVVVTGVPSGATLRDGINSSLSTGAAIDVSSWNLGAITLTPAGNDDSDFTLTTTVTATESSNSDTATKVSTTDITVTAVADAPTLSVTTSVSGNEDAAIALTGTGALVDTDGSETLTYLIAGVPTGAVLSAGTNNGDNTWTLTDAQAPGLTITSATNDDSDISLTVTAIATDTDGAPATTGPISVAVEVLAVADTPTINVVTPASGNEDTAISLTINGIGLTDTDGSETISGIEATNVPTGAVFSAGTQAGANTWTFTEAQLSGLKISFSTAHIGTDQIITFRSIASETNDGVADAQSDINDGQIYVEFFDIADPTTLTVSSPASGNEDEAIALTLSGSLVDQDGSELLTMLISNVPSGATLSAGTDNLDSTWTVAEADLSGLAITPPLNNNDDFTLTITATSTEQNGGSTQTDTGTIDVNVAAVNDPPTVLNQTFSIDENSPNGSVVGTVVANDIEAVGSEPAQNFSFLLSGTAFAIGSNGEITVADVSQLDFETTPQFTLTVTAADDGAPSLDDTATITIDLNGVNDNPPTGISDSVTLDEQATALFNVLDNDVDADMPAQVISVTKVNGSAANLGSGVAVMAGAVQVGTLTVQSDGSATFVASADDTVEVYSTSATYTVSDGVNESGGVAINITLNPINDNSPEITLAGSTFETDGVTIQEDQYLSFNKLVVVLNSFFKDLDLDADGLLDSSTSGDTDSITIAVVGNTNGALVSTNISPSNPADLEIWSPADQHGTADITLQVTDSAAPLGNISSVQMTFTVTVESVNDQPININGTYPDITVNEDSGAILLQLNSAFVDADLTDGDPSDDSLTYTITMDDAPNPFVTTAVVDITGLNVISNTANVPSPGSRRVVVETTDPTITLPLHTDAHGQVTVTVRASDLGRPPANPAPAAPLFDEDTFVLTVQSIGDDTPIANDDHYSTRPDLIIDEDSGPIAFIVTDNDYAGDAPILVLAAGQEITDSFGGDHSWRSSFRLADPDNIGSFQKEINGEVSCANAGCQDVQTPDTIIDGSQVATNQVLYRPRLNFNGEDTFIYCIQDDQPGSEAPFVKDVTDPRCAEITIMVNPVDDLPEPQDPITYTMDQADDLIVNVTDGLRTKVLDVDNTQLDGLGCDPLSPSCNPGPGDPQPDTLYFFITTAATNDGQLLPPFATDGSFKYRPSATFSGEDQFEFDVCSTPVPTADTCVLGVIAHIVVAAISGAPEGSSANVVEFDFNLAEVPLELPVGPEANVLVINDDSGSMGWDILTDQNNGYYYFSSGNYVRYALKATAGSSTYLAPSEQTVPGQGLWRIRNSSYNTVYYNPAIRYDPWEGLNSDDVEFPASIPTAAKHNPLTSTPTTNLRLPQDYTGRALVVGEAETCSTVCTFSWFGTCLVEQQVCTGGGGFQQVSEVDFYIPRYYTWTDRNGDGLLDATPAPADGSTTSEGTLVEIRPASEGGSDTYPKPSGRTDCLTNATTCTYTEELQNFANWFTYSRNREFTAKSALGKVVAAAENIRVGYAKLNSSSNTQRIQSMNTSERTGAKAALLDSIYQTISSGGTPLRRALRNAGRHYECRSGDTFGSNSNSSPGDANCPVLASPEGNCQQNYTLLISDGAWNGSSPGVGDPDDDGNTNFDGGVYASSSNDTLADVAMHYYERDLHSSLSNEVPTGGRDTAGAAVDAFENGGNDFMHQHMKSYTVGFGVNGEVQDGDVPTDYTQSFNWGSPTTTARKVDDMRHAAVNGRGQFLSAGDAKGLADALISAFEEFAQGSGAASAVSFNSQEIREDTLIFRSFYNTKTNTGELVAQPIDDNGIVGDVVWNSAVRLDLVTFEERAIMTWDPDAAQGIAFRPTTLTSSQRDVFISDQTAPSAQKDLEVLQRVNYLRGDSTNERPAGNFRERPVTEGRLGDIVHSAPTFIGAPSRLGRDAEPFPQGSNLYSAFRATFAERTDVVYTSANDGMLHGFDAATGDELFAYLPSNLMLGTYSRRITELLNFEYSHKFFVDLTPAVNDVFVDRNGDGSEEWTSLLVGGHGAGAKAYFALDVTDPTKFNEATASDVVLWEFTDADDTYPTAPNGTPLTAADGVSQRQDLLSPPQPVKDMGYSFSVPTLTMSNLTGVGPDGNDQRWISISGNGYNSTSGIAKLFILFLDGGTDGTWCHPDMIHNVTLNGSLPSECVGKQDFVKLDTGFGVENGVPNGLGEPRAIDVDGNGTADYVYAGDFFGNFYRFDITSNNFSDWSTTKIFKAEYDNGTTQVDQPITTQPIAIIHPSEDEGFIVIFGTGSYIRESDSTDPNIQSLYGIWDRLGPQLIDKSELVEQVYTNVVDELGRVRLLSANDVDYTIVGGKKGWYIDLDMPAAGQAVGSEPEFAGEKAIRNIQLRGGLAFVNSVFPRPQNSCVGQAGGATLSFCPDTGGSGCLSGRTVFDLNNDGFFNELDDVGPDSNQTALGRILEDSAPPTDATFIGDKRVTQFGKELDIVGTNTSFGNNTGRLSWKRLESVD